MPVNAATILGGPALVQYRGASFYTKNDIKLISRKETFDIVVDRFGPSDKRVSEEELRVEFDPAGEWEALSVLFRYADMLNGQLITPDSLEIEAVETTDDELTITGHGVATGTRVLFHAATGGSLPGGLSTLVAKYARAVDADTITLHDSAADAAANTAKVNLTSAGSGTSYVDVDHPLVIHTFAGTKLTLFNAALVQMPNLTLSTVQTLHGTVAFEAFLSNGAEWSSATARWSIEQTPLSDTTFDPANILTVPYTGAWGVSAPWSSFDTKEGFQVEFGLMLEPVMTDRLGIVSRRFVSLTVTVTAQPLGMNEQDVLAKLLLQNTGSKRGRSLSGDDLVIAGANAGEPEVTIYGAALLEGPQSFGSGTERVGALQWQATRTFTAGSPDPLFAVGTV